MEWLRSAYDAFARVFAAHRLNEGALWHATRDNPSPNIPDGLPLPDTTFRPGRYLTRYSTFVSGRMFTGEHLVLSEPSADTVFEGLCFDGQSATQGSYRRWQLEQASGLFLGASEKVPTSRLRATVRSCVFRDMTGDGIHVRSHTDAQITNVSMSNCFRGGLSMTAGDVDVLVTNLITRGDIDRTGFDIELDGGQESATLRVVNSVLDGDFDVGLRGGSSAEFVNVVTHAPPFNVVARDSRLKCVACRFRVGMGGTKTNRIIEPHDVVFDDCEFTLTAEDPGGPVAAAANIYWQASPGRRATGQRVVFSNCRFRTEGTFPLGSILGAAEEAGAIAVAIGQTGAHEHNTVVVQGCRIGAGFARGIHLALGGSLTVQDTVFDSDLALRLYGNRPTGLGFHVILDRVDVRRTKTYLMLRTRGDDVLQQRNIVGTAGDNTIRALVRGGARQPSTMVFIGGRILDGSDGDDAPEGLIGDEWRQFSRDAVSESLCTGMVFTTEEPGVYQSITWKGLR